MSRNIERDRFSKHKLNENNAYDYVVIGSGLGGLSSAAMLSRMGNSVLVLESHDRAGGSMHYFEERGYEFDTGIHYIGKPEKFETKMRLLGHPNFPLKLDLMGNQQDGFTYDRVFYGNDQPVEWKKQGLRKELMTRFPNERSGIETFMNYMENNKISEFLWAFAYIVPIWLGHILMLIHQFFYPDLHLSFQDLSDKLFEGEEIKLFLCGNFGNIGRFPSDSNAQYIISMIGHFDKSGGSYPRGGCQSLIKPFIPVIELSGGRVLVSALVEQIIISKNNVAMGVKVNGTLIRALRGVISSAGYPQTQLLCPLPDLPKDLCTTGQTHHVYVFIGLKCSQAELKLPSANYWCLEGLRKGETFEEYLRSIQTDLFQEGRCIGFIGFPSAKDTAFDQRHPGKSVCMLLTEVSDDLFLQWEDESHKKHAADYEELKAMIGKHLIKTVFLKHFPQLEDKIDHVQIGTPLTTAHYLKKFQGASYGLEHNCSRFANGYKYLRPTTPIGNLWLAGQDTFGLGYSAVFSASNVTASQALGISTLEMMTGGDVMSQIETMGPLSEGDFNIEYD